MIRKTTNILGFFLSFLLPSLLFLFMLHSNEIVPFGNYTLMCYDFQGQYISFLSYLRSIFLTNNDFIYTFAKPLGGDMISILTYYLFSPFNVLYLFVNNSTLPLMISILTTLKIALCGLTMYIFLNYLYKNKTIPNLILSLSYALSSYMIVFHFNIMWIDAVIMLPLIILGLLKIFEGKKPYFYSLMLGISILSNYYTGFMSCIFIVLFFLYKLYTVERENDEKKKLYKNFIIGSLLAGVISSFSWLNAVIAFSGTKTSLGNSNLTDFSFITSLSALMNSLSGNSYVGINDIISGAPLIFVGCFSLYLVILYFSNKAINYKEKIGSIILIAIFVASFFIRAIDNLWHGGSPPTWFTYRYAFIFDFFVIYLASKVLNEFRTEIEPKDCLFVLSFAVIQLVFALISKSNSMIFIEYAMAVIMLGSLICLVKFKQPAIQISCLVIIFIVNAVDLTKSGEENLKLNALHNAYMKNDEYQSDLNYITPIIDYIKDYDESGNFYRLEKTFYRSSTYNLANNDSFLFDYASMSHYSSSDKLNVRYFIGDRLGFHSNINWNSYGLGSTLAVNSLMNIKYIVDEDYFRNSILIPTRYFGARDYLQHLEDFPTNTSSMAHIFLNSRALGMGFMRKNVDYSIGRQSENIGTDSEPIYKWYNTFEYLNELFKDLSSENDEDIYKPIPTTISLNNVTSLDENHYYLTDTTRQGDIRFNLQLNDSVRKFPCYYSIYPRLQDLLTLYDNSGRNLYYFHYYNHGINPIEQKNQNTLTYRLTLKENLIWNDVYFKNDFFYEDVDVLDKYIAELKSNSLELKKISSSHLLGEVNYSDKKTLLMLSIPYDSNWKIKINGKKVKTRLVQDIFLGADLSTYGFSDGQTLKVELKYRDYKYPFIIAISLLGAAYILLIGYLELDKKLKKKTEEKV